MDVALYVQLGEEIEEQLRENAMKNFGYSKGAIKEAVEEAIKVWLASKPTGIQPQPLSVLRGMLKNVKISSVELKHSAAGLFAK